MDEQRSSTTRARAELVLVRLLHELDEEDVFLVVLGGLVPELLARADGLIPAHLGTTDVDVLLITHVDPDADLGGRHLRGWNSLPTLEQMAGGGVARSTESRSSSSSSATCPTSESTR
jgi:hypothetical protein